MSVGRIGRGSSSHRETGRDDILTEYPSDGTPPMRQTLFRVLLDQPWAVWTVDPRTGVEGVGIGILMLVIGLIWLAVGVVSSRADAARSESASEAPRSRKADLAFRVAVLGALLLAAHFAGPLAARLLSPQQVEPGSAPVPVTSFPVFGYGFMLLIGFMAALWFAQRRARLVGLAPETVFDAGFWLLIPGILGGRCAYLVQYADRVFADKAGAELLWAAINLTEGGLVLIGAIAGGAVGYLAFCYLRKINPLMFGDVIAPSVLIGIGFGRLGCLLNGCCFGDACALPWAITFPQGSVPFDVLTGRGFLDPAATATMPLHPTQIYSSINAFVLAFVTGTYFHYRRHHGDVFALALMLYPITRFIIEFLRNDELGQLGTGLTISQIYSLVMFGIGVALSAYLHLRGRTVSTPPAAAPHASPAS